jgi:predicted DNA-binding protein (MmcQ/YjbR family)
MSTSLYQSLLEFCGSLQASQLDHPFGPADVFKIGGKMFALGDAPSVTVSVKAAKELQDALCLDPAISPAPYLARGGWVMVTVTDEASLQLAKELILESHRLVALGMSRKKRVELGLEPSSGELP